MHWPNPEIPLPEAMPALAKAKRQGLARHIGVANFNIALLDQAISALPRAAGRRCRPSTIPISTSRSCWPRARKRGLVFIAYCPLGRGRLFGDPVLADIAAARGRSVAQIALRWLMQQDVAAIPRSSNPARIADNFNVFDFTLSDDEMARIAALKRPDGRIANPNGCPAAGISGGRSAAGRRIFGRICWSASRGNKPFLK